MGIAAANRITELMLEKFIKNVSYLDKADAAINAFSDENVPIEVLAGIRDLYAPLVSDEKLKAWYREGLKENSDV